MKLDIWSPMPPNESGIAHYVSTLFGAGFDEVNLKFCTSSDAVGRPEALQLYQLGNNPHHEFVYNAALKRPGIIEIHDFSLHHLVTELTLARGDSESYVQTLKEASGVLGYVFGMRRLNDHFHPRLEFELPLLEPLIRNAEHIIVHSKWARERVRMIKSKAPVTYIPHFCLTPKDVGLAAPQRDTVRRKYRVKPNEVMILSAGFVTEPKRLPWLVAALKQCYERGLQNFKLIIAGDAQDERMLEGARNFPKSSLVQMLGYQNEQEFDKLFLAADVIPVMRWPSVGEASGVATRALGFGAHVIALKYKSFADLPEDLVDLINLGGEDQIIDELTERLSRILANADQDEHLKSARRAYAVTHMSLPIIRNAYNELLKDLSETEPAY